MTLPADFSVGDTPRAAVSTAVNAAGGCDLCNLPVKALASSISRCRVQELCESRGGRPGLPVSHKPVDVNKRLKKKKKKILRSVTLCDCLFVEWPPGRQSLC